VRNDSVAGVVVIGDAVVDVLEEADGRRTRHPGGAGLNTAVGLAILGHEVTQVASLGHDADGVWIEDYLREHRVHLIRSDENATTGTATSRRVGGEPTYSFDDALQHRSVTVPAQAFDRLGSASAIIVSSFPFDDERQAHSACEALAAGRGLRAIDPNPRPMLLRDRSAFREGLRRALAHTELAKVSEDDIDLLYEGSEAEAIAEISGSGTTAILLTRGPRGATLVLRGGRRLDVPTAALPGDVVDTLGAGDATLAAFVSELLRLGGVTSDPALHDALEFSMRVAAATARHPGGQLRLPPPVNPG
jgi:fructokinase